MLKGAITAMITPFKETGQLDLEGLKRNVTFQIEQGISGLVPLGTTGESPTINGEERRQVIKTVIDEAKGRVPIIVGTGTNSTRTTVEYTQQAKDMGADAALIVNPYYNKPTQEGLFRHFKAVATRVDIPIIIYNIKSRTAVNVETPTMKRFRNFKNIVGVKEASGDLNQMKDVIAAMGIDFDVLSGDDNMTYDLMHEGGRGVISVVSNIVPAKVSEMCKHAMNKNWEEAKNINGQLAPLYRAAFIETNPIPIKTAMNLAKMPAGPLRLPLCQMNSANVDQLKRTLNEMQLLKSTEETPATPK